MLLRFALVALVLLLPSSSTAEPLTPEKAAAISELMDLTGSGAMQMGSMMSQSIVSQMTTTLKSVRPDLPPEAFDILAEEVNKLVEEDMGEFMAVMHPIYHEQFTLEEIQGLIAFNKTPLGQKVLRVMPQIMQKAMVAGQAWGRGLAPKLQERLKMRFQQAGIEL